MDKGVGRTLFIAAALCIVCSIIVSSSAVLLKPKQELNKSLDFKKNILEAAGLLKGTTKDDIEAQYRFVQPRVVNINTGEVIYESANNSYEQSKADKDPTLLEELGSDDPAGISRRSKLQTIYLIKNEVGQVEQIVLRVYGRGLWSTMYGFVALDKDLRTVRGFSYYEHGETPGLGGEVDNPKWKAKWRGKKLFDENFNPALTVVKGAVDLDGENAEYKIDGLSGATLTSKGVQGTFSFWMSDRGYKRFLEKFKTQLNGDSLNRGEQ